MLKRKVAFYCIFLAFLPALYAGTDEEYWELAGRYTAGGFSSIASELSTFIGDNPDYFEAYPQLYGWCQLAGDYSPLMQFIDADEPSGRYLYGIYLFRAGKEEEGLALMFHILNNPDAEISTAFGFHFCDFLWAASGSKLKEEISGRVSSLKPLSSAQYILKARFYYEKGDLNDFALSIADGFKKYPADFMLNSYYTYRAPDLETLTKTIKTKNIEKFLERASKEDFFHQAVVCFVKGTTSSTKGENKEALNKFDESAKLYEKYGFITFKPDLILASVTAYRNTEDYKSAEAELLKSKLLFEKIGNPFYLFYLHRSLGDLLTNRGAYEEGFNNFKTAAKEVVNPAQKLHIHQSISTFYLRLRKYAESLKETEAGLELAYKADNNIFKIAFHNQAANILSELGRLDEAFNNSEKAIASAEKEENKSYLVTTLATKANSLQFMGRFADARDVYLEALKLCEKTSTPLTRAKLLGSLGTLAVRTNELLKAKKYLSDAASVFSTLKDRYNLAITTGNLGQVYYKNGEYARALKTFQEAVDLARDLRDIRSTAIYYTGMGSVYKVLGNRERALFIYGEAEKIYRQMQSKQYLGDFYINLAGVYYDFGDYKNADFYDKKAEELYRELNETWSLFNCYSNQFVTAWSKKDVKRMSSSLSSMEKLAAEMKDSYVNAELNLMEAVMLNTRNRTAEARKKLDAALGVLKNYRMRAAWVYYELGLSYKKEKKYKEALDNLAKALDLIETERQNLRLGAESSGFLERNRDYYYEYIETLYLYFLRLKTPDIKDLLFSAVERFKERSFADLLAESRAPLDRRIDKTLKDREINLLGRISKYNTDINYADNEESLKNALLQRDKAEQELEQLKLEIRAKNPVYAGLSYPSPASAENIQNIFPGKTTVMISYFILDKYLYTFCITRDGIEVWRHKNARRIEKDSRELISLLQKPDPAGLKRLRFLAASLYNRLLLPVQKAGLLTKEVIIVPDEVLYYLPFEALIDHSGRYVIENHNVIYTPSATALLLLSPRKRSDKNDLFAMANPTIEKTTPAQDLDSGTISAERGFDVITLSAPLPYAENEVKDISALFGDGKVSVFTGGDAKEEKLKSEELTGYRFLHFATHGILDESYPFRSGLLLAIDTDPKEDGLLQYREIYDLDTNADMVVLSACKSGLGKVVKGDGLIGISRGFLATGARSVVVSLWNVSDMSTSFLMREFYKNIIEDRLPAAEALRRAKLALIKMKGGVSPERGIIGITPGRKTERSAGFAHPYFWAPFIIIGRADREPGF